MVTPRNPALAVRRDSEALTKTCKKNSVSRGGAPPGQKRDKVEQTGRGRCQDLPTADSIATPQDHDAPHGDIKNGQPLRNAHWSMKALFWRLGLVGIGHWNVAAQNKGRPDKKCGIQAGDTEAKHDQMAADVNCDGYLRFQKKRRQKAANLQKQKARSKHMNISKKRVVSRNSIIFLAITSKTSTHARPPWRPSYRPTLHAQSNGRPGCNHQTHGQFGPSDGSPRSGPCAA